MSTTNRFAKHSINTPSSSHAVQKSKVVNVEVIAPFTQRYSIAIVRDTGMRLPCCPVFDRGFESLLNTPSKSKSASDYAKRNTNSFGPICYAQSFRFVRQHHILASVSVLLMPRLPSAVVRFVVAVIVYSSYGSAREWLRSHILKKRLKGFPAVTDFDSAISVVFAMFAVGVSATIQYACPYLIFSGVRHTVFSALALFASRCFALSKAFASGDFFVSAFTDASPENTTISVLADTLDDRECAESFASYVFEASAVSDRIRISHVSAPLSDSNVVRAVSELELRYCSLLLQNTLAA